jgi:hypothetical protein
MRVDVSFRTRRDACLPDSTITKEGKKRFLCPDSGYTDVPGTEDENKTPDKTSLYTRGAPSIVPKTG